jgi:hypothetical protein
MPKRSFSTISKHDMDGGVEDLHVFFGARIAGARPYFVIVFPLKPRPTQTKSRREFVQIKDPKDLRPIRNHRHIGKARFMAIQNFSTYLILKFSMDVEYARPEYNKSFELILKLLH